MGTDLGAWRFAFVLHDILFEGVEDIASGETRPDGSCGPFLQVPPLVKHVH